MGLFFVNWKTTMTSIAWDGRYLVADTRSVVDHIYDKSIAFAAEELEWLHQKLKEPTALHFSNKYQDVIDGECKIFIPEKELFWHKERVRAVAVSGDLTKVQGLAKLPNKFELQCVRSPLYAKDRDGTCYIIITDERLVRDDTDRITDNKRLVFLTITQGKDLFECAGLGSVNALCGKPPVISAEDFVNVCCIINRTNGGQVDVWDGVTGELTRRDLYPFTKSAAIIHKFYTQLLGEYRKTKKDSAALSWPADHIYPDLYPTPEENKQT